MALSISLCYHQEGSTKLRKRAGRPLEESPEFSGQFQKAVFSSRSELGMRTKYIEYRLDCSYLRFFLFAFSIKNCVVESSAVKGRG